MNAILMNNAIALDSASEYEINSDGFGMTVFVQLVDGTMMLLQNVTEVHWRFKADWRSGERVAFESDVHREGFTHAVDDIVLCTMRPADKRHSQGKVFR